MIDMNFSLNSLSILSTEEDNIIVIWIDHQLKNEELDSYDELVDLVSNITGNDKILILYDINENDIRYEVERWWKNKWDLTNTFYTRRNR